MNYDLASIIIMILADDTEDTTAWLIVMHSYALRSYACMHDCMISNDMIAPFHVGPSIITTSYMNIKKSSAW